MTTTLKRFDGLQGRALPEDAPVRDALVRAHDPECDANSNAASGGFVGAPLVGRPSVGVDLVGEASVRLQAERQGGVVKERHALHLSGTLRAFRFLLGPDDEEPGAAHRLTLTMGASGSRSRVLSEWELMLSSPER